jgi:hypothetical protein
VPVWRRLGGRLSRLGLNDFLFDLDPLAEIIAQQTDYFDGHVYDRDMMSSTSSSTLAKNAAD